MFVYNYNKDRHVLDIENESKMVTKHDKDMHYLIGCFQAAVSMTRSKSP